MESINVAVVISTYNGENFLLEQIHSILSQNYFQNKNCDFRILIRDDGSTDKTVNILQDVQKQYEQIEIVNDSLGNIGVIASFFELLKKAKNYDVVFLSDQDDVWHEDKVKKMLKFYDVKTQSNEVVGLYSDAWISDQNATSIGIKMSEMYNWKGHPLSIGFLTWGFRITGANYAINRKAVETVLRISQQEMNIIAMHDAAIGLIVEIYGKNFLINEPLLNYRQHANNVVGAKGSSNNPFKRVRDVKKLINSIILNNSAIYMFLERNRNGVSNNMLNHFKKYYVLMNSGSLQDQFKATKKIKKDIWWKHKAVVLLFIFLTSRKAEK